MARPSRDQLIKYSRILIACLLAIALRSSLLSPSSPGTIESHSPSYTLPFPSNSKLQEVTKLGEGLLKQPEDVAVDRMGVLYTVTRDGWVKRLLKNGTWENWWHIDSDGLLGLATTAAGDIVVCDAYQGLLKVGEGGTTVLASHVNGTKIRFADDVVESSDGMLYFSDASTRFEFHSWYQDLREGISSGRLIQYDPLTNTASVLLTDLGFANGVALSQDQDYLVVCETSKYRCLKYWLEGDAKGQTEIFIDNLPGGPDNINLALDGSFWIALLEVTPSSWLRILYKWRASKYLIGASQNLVLWQIGIRNKAMVVNVGSNGKIVRGFDDPTGKVMAFLTSALEFEGHLYLGSLHNNFVGKLSLAASSAKQTR